MLAPASSKKVESAFTLIELLVVIAIIAIIAAILFPVFGRAKLAAKQISGLANLKQMATSVHIYVADYDDLAPTTYAPWTPARGYSHNLLIPVPYTWATSATPEQINAFQTFWGNNVQPYIKNINLYFDPGTTPDRFSSISAGTPPSSVTNSISYTFNGLLSGYSMSAITEQTRTPVFWMGRGALAMVGYGYVNPYLECKSYTNPCVYVPATGSCNLNATNPNGVVSFLSNNSRNKGYDVYHSGINFSYADSSAKWRKLGIGTNGLTDPKIDPFHEYQNSNQPKGQWYDQYRCHLYMFRPDFDFGNEPGTPNIF